MSSWPPIPYPFPTPYNVTPDVQVDGSNDLFTMYMETAEKEDKEMSERWTTDADSILVFVSSLFTAHVTDGAFLFLMGLYNCRADCSLQQLPRPLDMSFRTSSRTRTTHRISTSPTFTSSLPVLMEHRPSLLHYLSFPHSLPLHLSSGSTRSGS